MKTSIGNSSDENKRPMASALWRAYTASDKKHIILTGTRQIGKSTLLLELLSLIPNTESIPGIITAAQPQKAVYLTDTVTGTTACIGTYDDTCAGTENKMCLISENLLSYGLAALNTLKQTDSTFAYIDEIGYLETNCKEYCDEILNLFDCKRMICVLRKQNLPFLQALLNRRDVFVVDLDTAFSSVGCVIMASGTGKRFGSNKLMADLHGKKLIESILSSISHTFINRIVVTRHPDIVTLCKKNDTEVLLHNLPYRNDTIRLGLQQLEDKVTWCMFCPSDQPFLAKETIQTMALYAANYPEAMIRLTYEDTYGAPVLFPKKYFEQLKNLPQGKGGNAIMKEHPDQVLSIQAKEAYELMDVDTQEDLEYLRSVVNYPPLVEVGAS